MKKSIGVFIAAILVVCLFAGCAETASTENAGAAETPAVPAAAESVTPLVALCVLTKAEKGKLGKQSGVMPMRPSSAPRYVSAALT